jgi:5-methylcytosine-specific restriction endonuclease McrA
MPQRVEMLRPARANYKLVRRDNGPNAHQRGYCSPQHKAWRLAVLERDNWQCRACGRACAKRREAHADHIIAVATRPDLRYEVANGQCLCASCHACKTAAERRGSELPVVRAPTG